MKSPNCTAIQSGDSSFLAAVLGGVACHYIIKWLDGDGKGNN